MENTQAIYFLFVSYDGTKFNGSQIQGDLPTVQGILNEKLSIILRTPIETYGASRTDEGVHALMNVYHFILDEHKMIPELAYKLNSILPPYISVNAIEVSHDLTKNCRFDPIYRRYRYKIHFHKSPFLYQRSYYYPYKLDIEVLQETASVLRDYTEFGLFAKKNSQTYTNICYIKDSYWKETEDGIEFIVEANRFLRGMVRALVGTQLHVGRGKYDVAEFRRRIESQNSQLADFSVPGHGLYLEHIEYPEDYFKE